MAGTRAKIARPAGPHPTGPRLAGPLDPLIMADIHHAAFPADLAWDGAFIAGLMSTPGVFGLLCPTGMALARVAADESELLTIGVLPEARGQGVGRHLLSQVIAEVKSRGAACLLLEVAETNHAAQALYHRAGFQHAGLRRNYYAPGAHAALLRLDLTGS